MGAKKRGNVFFLSFCLFVLSLRCHFVAKSLCLGLLRTNASKTQTIYMGMGRGRLFYYPDITGDATSVYVRRRRRKPCAGNTSVCVGSISCSVFIVLTRPGKNPILKKHQFIFLYIWCFFVLSHTIAESCSKDWPDLGAVAVVGAGLLQMIIRRDQAFEMIIQSGRPLANDHPEWPASCKWSSGGAGLL